MPMRPTWGTRLGFGCPTADSEQTGSPTVLAAAIRLAAATACGDVNQVVVPGPLPVTVGAGVMGSGVCEGRAVGGGGLGRVVVGDGGGGGTLGRVVLRDGRGALGRVVARDGDGGGALGRVVVGDGESGGALGPCGVTDGPGVCVWGGAGFVVGVCAGGVCTGGRTGVVRWGAGRVAGGTGGTVRVGLGAGVRGGFGVDGAGELGADGRGDRDGDGVDADGVTTGDGVWWEALPPWSDDSSAQAARPPPRATTAAPPAIHGAFRDGRRCRFMILTVHPIADGLKPEPSRSRAGAVLPARPGTDGVQAPRARQPARLAAPTTAMGGPVGGGGSPLREGGSDCVTSVKRAPSCWRWLPLCGSLSP
jgi:hypothetical protein